MTSTTKTRSVRYPILYLYGDDFNPNSVLSKATDVRTLTRTTTGGLNPNWRLNIRNHTNATTAFSGTFENIRSRPGYMKVGWRSEPYVAGHPRTVYHYLRGDVAPHGEGIPTGSYGTVDFARNSAYIRFNAAVQKTQRSIEGGVLLGELRETLGMLRSPAKSLLKGIGEYLSAAGKRSRGVRKKPAIKKIIADSWLEYSFGWVPFLNDIKDARKLLSKIGQKETMVKVTAGGESDTVVIQGVPTPTWYSSYIACQEITDWTEKSHCRVKGEVYVRAVTDQQTILQEAGLTFDQFIPTLWELCPWSFLVDYFTNIGDILSYSNSVYANLAWWSVGTRTELVKTKTISPDFSRSRALLGASFVSAEGSQMSAELSRVTITRSADPGLVTYNPSFQFNANLRDNQLLNIAALLGSANRISPQRFKP